MNGNNLSCIPDGIKGLCRLETFHVSKNPIKSISREFKFLTRLKDFCIDWIAYINFNSTKDNTRVEESKDHDLWKVIKQVLYYRIDDICDSS